jgi:hypothetical protein
MYISTHARGIGGSSDFDNVAYRSFGLFATVVLTTLHVQDFADVIGDATTGRVTFPILFPRVSRYFTFVALIAWSYGLVHIWNLGPISSTVFCALGLLVGGRNLAYRTFAADTLTYIIYNVRFRL